VIVAEGVERREELEVLRESQIDFAQGWLFGRPGRPWPEVPLIEADTRRATLSASAVRRLSALEQGVAVAGTPAEAAEAAVEHLAHLGMLPSVYLQQGERLRCVAARGYYALHDGITPEAGLVGRAYSSGQVVDVSDVSETPNYLRSTAAVKTARCVPVHIGTRVVGVVCVESAAPIGTEPASEADRAGEVLGRRLGELGVIEAPTPGQRLARAAARAATVEDPDTVIREAAAAALEVSGFESVMIGLCDARGSVHAHHAAGPLADELTALSPAELAAMARWVEPGTTLVSMADATGRGDVVSEILRQSGVGALLVVPLAVGRARLGFLALADRSTTAPDTERTELIELLGVQTAAQLRGLAAVGELRDRATRDPLTGLGHEQAFQTRLPRRRKAAADAGRKVAVVLAEVDGVAEVNERSGHAAGDEILRGMATILAEIATEPGSAYRLGGDEFALLVDTTDRGAAQEVAWQLQAQVRERLGMTVSIGVAVADGDETDAQLLKRADAAVVEVKRRGRDGVALAPSVP